MTRKFLTPIILPADPAAAMEAATKQYIDGLIVPLRRWRGTRASANIASGDSGVNLTEVENVGGFTFTANSNAVTITNAGTYAVYSRIGGVTLTAGTALVITLAGGSTAFPAQTGTTWQCGGTVVATVPAGSTAAFTFRNASATALAVSATVEIVCIR